MKTLGKVGINFTDEQRAQQQSILAALNSMIIHTPIVLDINCRGGDGGEMFDGLDLGDDRISYEIKPHPPLTLLPEPNHPHGWYRKFDKPNGKRNK